VNLRTVNDLSIFEGNRAAAPFSATVATACLLAFWAAACCCAYTKQVIITTTTTNNKNCAVVPNSCTFQSSRSAKTRAFAAIFP